jgi:predicted nucleic acid-binding protein
MRILIDTNIFIYREDDQPIKENLQRLLRILNETNVTILIHPASIKEIEKDKDKKRRETILSKIETYPILKKPPEYQKDTNFTNIIGLEKNTHDENDNAILYTVYRDAVDFLITEDKGIHKKAKEIKISDRIFLIQDALEFFEEYTKTKPLPATPALKKDFVYNLDINDPIFDSLKKEYEGFESWFKKIARKGRECLVSYRSDGSIGAVLIYKIEDESIEDSTPRLPKKKRVKICTLKVTHIGHKIGELFIKMCVNYAINNQIYEIYLTHFTQEEDMLLNLITQYGFSKAAVKKNKEEIYLKKLTVEKEKIQKLSFIEIDKQYYPSLYDGEQVNKYIIPIRPEYYNRLFTDSKERQSSLTEYSGDFIVEGNTIKKAYLTHSKIKKMNPGDIIIFYLSKGTKQLSQIRSMGVIEEIYQGVKDSNDIIKYVGKRTVYSKEEIKQMSQKPTTVILFQHHFYLEKPLSLNKLLTMNILSAAPQTITGITHKKYLKIKEEGGIDKRFTFN